MLMNVADKLAWFTFYTHGYSQIYMMTAIAIGLFRFTVAPENSNVSTCTIFLCDA
jgi:hypothetical protein